MKHVERWKQLNKCIIKLSQLIDSNYIGIRTLNDEAVVAIKGLFAMDIKATM